MINQYGTLLETNGPNGRYALRLERYFPHSAEEVFRMLTDPGVFSQWYPFATGEMDLRIGGKISFDDGEGTTYEGIITELNPPYGFAFREDAKR